MDKVFMPSFKFGEWETADFRGWTARVCIKCQCVRLFIVQEFIEHTSVRISVVPITSTSRRTKSYLCQCDFCGNSLRYTPKVIRPTCATEEEFLALVMEAAPEAGPEHMPHLKLNGVFSVLSEAFAKHAKARLPFRSNIGWIAAVFGVLTIGGFFCILQGMHQGDVSFSSEIAFYAAGIICILVAFIVSLGVVRLFARAQFRSECKDAMIQRFGHLRQRYGVPDADIKQTEEILLRLL